MAQKSIVHSHRSGRSISRIKMSVEDVAHYASLAAIGLHFSPTQIQQAARVMLGDGNDIGPWSGAQSGITAASVVTPIQFLQMWLPGFVHVVTAARKIDNLVGITTAGSPEDEQIVQGVLESAGRARPYQDNSSLPLASWNPNFETRTVVRFEQGLEVGWLEEQRSARARIATAAEKRNASALTLEVERNRVGFYGFNNGANRTYGLLNDPAIPAYQNVPNGAGGSATWASKTFLEITKDLRFALQSLRTNSRDVIDPEKTPITLAIATSRVDLLTTTTDFGISVRDWLRKDYPNVRIESAPELDDANGGAAVFYMYADTVSDDYSTDDSATFVQVVPAKFLTVGVEKRAKTYVEAFANATAGVMCKRPFAVQRFSGI